MENTSNNIHKKLFMCSFWFDISQKYFPEARKMFQRQVLYMCNVSYLPGYWHKQDAEHGEL